MARQLDQSQKLDQIHRYVLNASSHNKDAAMRRAEWIAWYESLGWHQRHLDPLSMALAKDYCVCFISANGSAFGAERRTLKQGMKGDDVKTMQGIVGVSPADGNYGPGTKRAVQAWQQKNGLAPDGVFGPASWAKSDSGTITDADREKVLGMVGLTSAQTTSDMYSNPITHDTASKQKILTTTPSGDPMPSTAVTHPTIRQGSTGDAVKEWQGILGVKPDGKFGPGTASATKVFQSSHQLKPDGVVGPQTWMAAYTAHSGATNTPSPGAVIDSTGSLPAAIAPTTAQVLSKPAGDPVWQKPQGTPVPSDQIASLIGRTGKTSQASMFDPRTWGLGEKIIVGLGVVGAVIFGSQSMGHHPQPQRRRR